MRLFPSLFGSVKKPAHLEVGSKGERIARQYLRSLGYAIKGENIRLGKLEIDLLAHDPADNVLVFAEVKSRKTLSHNFRPELNLTPRKRRSMAAAARLWVSENSYEDGYRMDLLCIAEGKVINHFKEISWE